MLAHRGRSQSDEGPAIAIPMQGLNKKRRKRFLRYLWALQRLACHPAIFLLIGFALLVMWITFDRALDDGRVMSIFLPGRSSASEAVPITHRSMRLIAHGPCVHAQNIWKTKGSLLVPGGNGASIQELGVHYSVPLLRFSRGQIFRLTPSADFDLLYQNLWDSKGYRMKYALKKELKEKKLKGSGRYVVQYVQGRSKRPLNPAAEKIQVIQSFTHDEKAFNFMMSPLEEVLFALRTFERFAERELYFQGTIPIPDFEKERYSILECKQYFDVPLGGPPPLLPDWRNEMAAILVNIHPFSYGCAVVIVRPSAKLPQVVTKEALEIGWYLAAHSADGLRVGYNSLGGGASVNHLHFQAWYFNATKDGLLAIENARTKTLQTYENGITVAQVEGYPLPALVYSRDASKIDNGDREVLPVVIGQLIDMLFSCLSYMLKNNIPHNIIVSARAERVFLIPRSPQRSTRFEGRLGFPEVAGEIIVVSEETFKAFKTDADAEEFIASVGLSASDFNSLKEHCLA